MKQLIAAQQKEIELLHQQLRILAQPHPTQYRTEIVARQIRFLGRRCVNFRSVTESITTESAGGRFVMHIHSARLDRRFGKSIANLA